jgi:hypothetical protein
MERPVIKSLGAPAGFIRLGTAGPYLLPVEAEVLSCQRGTSICSRNKIEFRNYRKFGAESDITFDKPQ